MDFLIALTLILSLIGAASGLISLVMILAMKNSTHNIQWMDASAASVTDEQLEAEMLKPGFKTGDNALDFSEGSGRSRAFPSMSDW